MKISRQKIFYWESLNERYKFKKGLKYLIYFRGGFCPPHRGHFETIEQFLKIGPNIRAIIDQVGNPKRHGVPYYLNRKIWKIYISELLDKSRVSLQSYSSMKEIIKHPFYNKSDIIIYIRGIESNNNSSIQNKIIKKTLNTLYKICYDNKLMFYYYLERPRINILSASIFVNDIIKYKKMKFSEKYHKLKFYLPNNLSYKSGKFIIKNLEKYNLY